MAKNVQNSHFSFAGNFIFKELYRDNVNIEYSDNEEKLNSIFNITYIIHFV